MSAAKWLVRTATLFALLVLAMLWSRPSQADAFDGARKTFQTDIPHFFTQDVPHFFQDDVPCAFGGHPTSGAKKSCASRGPSDGSANRPKEPPPKNDKGGDSPPSAPQ